METFYLWFMVPANILSDTFPAMALITIKCKIDLPYWTQILNYANLIMQFNMVFRHSGQS